jgi:hypothetical protein
MEIQTDNYEVEVDLQDSVFIGNALTGERLHINWNSLSPEKQQAAREFKRGVLHLMDTFMQEICEKKFLKVA